MILTTIVFLHNCVSLTPGGKLVRTGKSDPPRECSEIGPASEAGIYKDAIVRLRNTAAEQGGNYVRLDVARQAQMDGTIYKCPE